jgi:hypothetical protein
MCKLTQQTVIRESEPRTACLKTMLSVNSSLEQHPSHTIPSQPWTPKTHPIPGKAAGGLPGSSGQTRGRVTLAKVLLSHFSLAQTPAVTPGFLLPWPFPILELDPSTQEAMCYFPSHLGPSAFRLYLMSSPSHAFTKPQTMSTHPSTSPRHLSHGPNPISSVASLLHLLPSSTCPPVKPP